MSFQAFDHYEEYEFLEAELNRQDQRYRRQQRRRGRPRRDSSTARSELTDFSDNEHDFVPSYAASLDPLHHERQWLINSVGSFYRDNIITDVTRIVKGGKEANVYCCLANPTLGLDLIAAKLYRPRVLRHLKNDAMYKAGRQLRDVEGKQMKGRRVKLALRKKTRFGKKVDIEWWIGNEFRAQSLLYEAGADVPRPVAHRGNTVLMAYLGDEWAPAPTLNDVSLGAEEAHPLFERIMGNVSLMLEHHLVHGDLSAYNILYWEGQITIIDFPQLVEARTNPNAFMLLERDIRRVCDYFANYGVESDPVRLAAELWEPYMGRSF